MAAEPELAAKCVSEFVGTFLLMLTVGCVILSNAAVWGGLAIASALMVCIYAFGGISGANFNPAVSVSLGISKAMGGPGLDWQTVGIYSVVQTAAGVLATLFASILGEPTAERGETMFSIDLGPKSVSHNNVAGAVMSCEMLYTFMLCFVVLNVAAAKKNAQEKNQYYGLAIGFVIAAGAYGAGAVSGGCFNPAVAVGIDVVTLLGSNSTLFGLSPYYVVAELVGAVLAAVCFYLVRPSEFEKEASQLAKFISEFIGTYFLVLTVGLNVMGKSKATAFSIAASLTSMIYALGDVSGAHFNPAVTIAIYASGRDAELSKGRVLKYAAAQILGGMSAGFSYAWIYHTTYTFAIGPEDGYSWLQALFAEFLYTFLLCFVVLSVAVSKTTKTSQMFGLAIGACVIVGGFAIGDVSGGALNPAVCLGISTGKVSGYSWLRGVPSQTLLDSYPVLSLVQFVKAMAYTGAEVAGGVAAAVAFKFTHDHDTIQEVKFM
eukprot:TRINITY_DN874_c2_g1_i1.p1 TRINITY_DN874_c2_g1~~TRINITY_DN874_c2_g1_i1.p1  ORF type:complete len:490 (+),score=86.26 TRINITY_DN874_c2_g1_i1:138-1607(+)